MYLEGLDKKIETHIKPSHDKASLLGVVKSYVLQPFTILKN